MTPNLKGPSEAASVHLDALRGIAAVGVCLSHLRDLFIQDYPKIPHHNALLSFIYFLTGLGHQWVVVFFVLSGYLVGGSVLRSYASSRWSWGDYMLNRLTRLYFVLIPALILGGLFDLYGIHQFGTAGIYGGHTEGHMLVFAVKPRLSLAVMLGNYAFLQNIFVPVFGSNSPLWSLSYEFWYYIAFPLLAGMLWKRTKLLAKVLSAVLLIVWVYFVGHEIAWMGLIWLMGVTIHLLPSLPVENAGTRKLLGFGAVALLMITLAWCKATHAWYSDYVLGVAVTILVYLILCCARKPMPALYSKPAQQLAHMSYTLYLVHVPLLVFLTAWMGGRRWLPSLSSLGYTAAIFVLVLAYAWVVYFCFERNTDAMRRWLKKRIFASREMRANLTAAQ